MRERNLLAALCGTLLAIGACREQAPPATAPPPPEVAVSLPLLQAVQESMEFPATTTAIESVEIRPRVTGFLREIHFTPRQRVARGDLLFTIDTRPFRIALERAQGDLAVVRAQLESAEFDARKTQGLYTSGDAAEQELVNAQAALDRVKAQIATAEAAVEQAQLNLDWCSVTAPISGRISRNLVDVGNIVSADQTLLATITNDDAIYAYFDVSEQEVLEYRQRHAAEIAAEDESSPAHDPRGEPAFLKLMTEPEFTHAGEIDYVAPALDPGTGTLQVRARFPNPSSLLLAGVFARVRLPVGEPHQALLVTERSLGSDQGQRYLLIVNDNDVVERRIVELGEPFDGLREIAAGIGPEDRVIVNGLQRARPGATVRPNLVAMPAPPGITSRPAISESPTAPAVSTQPGGR